MVSGHADSVDQTMARSLRVLMKINDTSLSHTHQQDVNRLLEKDVFQNGADKLVRFKLLSCPFKNPVFGLRVFENVESISGP